MVTILSSTNSSRYRASSGMLQLVVGLLWRKISLVEISKGEDDRRLPGLASHSHAFGTIDHRE